MRLYVGNIPPLAGEQAVERWFAEAGVRVKSIHFTRDGQRGAVRDFCWVEIAEAGIPRRGLSHLNKRAFWGRPLVVREFGPAIGGTDEFQTWFPPAAA